MPSFSDISPSRGITAENVVRVDTACCELVLHGRSFVKFVAKDSKGGAVHAYTLPLFQGCSLFSLSPLLLPEIRSDTCKPTLM